MIQHDPDEFRRGNVLGSSGVLAKLADTSFSKILQSSKLYIVKRLVALDLGNTIAVLGAGRVRIARSNDTGHVRWVVSDFRRPGDLVGEEILVGPPLGNEYMMAELGEVVLIPREVLAELLSTDIGFTRAFLKYTARHRFRMQSRFEALLTRTIESRIAAFLLEEAQRDGVRTGSGIRLRWKYTHEEMASYIGSTRETLTSTLGVFKRAGLIRFERRYVVVIDREALESRS
ncbi:MAG: Crp/Fnr family transcriptional regulator [Myxococcota bacterium]